MPCIGETTASPPAPPPRAPALAPAPRELAPRRLRLGDAHLEAPPVDLDGADALDALAP